MLPLQLLLMLAQRNVKLRLLKRLLSHVRKRLQKSLKTPQRFSSCIWKSSEVCKNRYPNAITRLSSWNL
ncbi:hypothetical protein DY000_02005876 [Brassica cretica]|uniref:Uncharacterized protein n=1 Tax=Brassica cretica TaxID=69181 RepID=A0ABQ7C5N8_BRACR|nr:hypothetical protein DY000_02005876 [Brassica cretica]